MSSLKNIIEIDQCPACGSKDIEPLAAFKSLPAILFPVEGGENAVHCDALYAYSCDTCRHIFLNSINESFVNNIYKDYYHLYPFKKLESMQEPYRLPFDKVARFFMEKEKAKLLEIGCDDVGQMQQFIERGYACSAINPGATHSKEVDFIDGFYGNDEVNGRFDYIISRFNLEHILNLDSLFLGLSKNLSDGGLIFVQVPNVEYFLNAGMLNIFAHEHLQYFCRTSLSSLIERHGYELIHVSSSNAPSLICVFKKGNKQYRPRKLMVDVQKIYEKLKLVIEETEGQVIIYGCSLSLTKLLYDDSAARSKLENFVIVDDNTFVHGRYMPNTPHQIFDLDRLTIRAGSTVVLALNEEYHPRVIDKLRNTITADCRFMAIGQYGLVDITDSINKRIN